MYKADEAVAFRLVSLWVADHLTVTAAHHTSSMSTSLQQWQTAFSTSFTEINRTTTIHHPHFAKDEISYIHYHNGIVHTIQTSCSVDHNAWSMYGDLSPVHTAYGAVRRRTHVDVLH